MNRLIKIFIFILIFNFFNLSLTFADEKDYFLTLRYNKVKVRSGPSLDHPVKFIYKKKMLPVKIIDSHDKFKNIIDFYNNSGWIHISQLSKKKSAINTDDIGFVFKNPNIYSKPIVKLEKGKMVIIKKCKKNWCKILIQGNLGWVKKKSLWGKF